MRNRRASSPRHHEFQEKAKPQRLVALLRLDGKTILPVPSSRRGSISLDIPFYRTPLPEVRNVALNSRISDWLEGASAKNALRDEDDGANDSGARPNARVHNSYVGLECLHVRRPNRFAGTSKGTCVRSQNTSIGGRGSAFTRQQQQGPQRLYFARRGANAVRSRCTAETVPRRTETIAVWLAGFDQGLF